MVDKLAKWSVTPSQKALPGIFFRFSFYLTDRFSCLILFLFKYFILREIFALENNNISLEISLNQTDIIENKNKNAASLRPRLHEQIKHALFEQFLSELLHPDPKFGQI